MKLNGTDLIFYGSTLAGLLALFAKLETGYIPSGVLVQIGIVAIIVNFLAFAFYEKINGTTPPPTPPQ